jgi:hypothetical protein
VNRFIAYAMALMLPSVSFAAAVSWANDVPTKLQPVDALPQAFGASVALTGNRLIVGAPTYSAVSGYAVIYEFDGARWVVKDILRPAFVDPSFGRLVAADGSRVVVAGEKTIYEVVCKNLPCGRPRLLRSMEARVDSVAVSRERFAVAVASEESVYVYGRFACRNPDDDLVFEPDTAHALLGIVRVSGLHPQVALQGDRLVVGQSRIDDWRALVYRFDGLDWSQEAVLAPPKERNPRPHLLHAVAIAGNRVLVGTVGSEPLEAEGAAYIFRFDGRVWREEAAIFPPDDRFRYSFGSPVALHGDLAVVAAGVARPAVPSVFLYRRTAAGWALTAELQPAGLSVPTSFGNAMAVSGSVVVVSDPTNGGSVYVFEQQLEAIAKILFPVVENDRYERFEAILYRGLASNAGGATVVARWYLDRLQDGRPPILLQRQVQPPGETSGSLRLGGALTGVDGASIQSGLPGRPVAGPL